MKRLSLLFFFVMFLISCGNDDNDCSGNLVCTTEFRSILVEVLNSDGTRVIFDEFTVTNLQTNETINLEWESGDFYPIADDSMRHDLPSGGQQLELVGFINGQEVLRQVFLVGADCCHILLLEGDTTIQL
ncbi:MAG: hypothetical protein R8G66_08600 [Cytophagales bacterium]|nr:hypothetical protein [Cytophagales bacterium]